MWLQQQQWSAPAVPVPLAKPSIGPKLGVHIATSVPVQADILLSKPVQLGISLEDRQMCVR